MGIPGSLPPEVLTPAEPVGTVQGALPAATGVPLHIAGHDHAVAAWVAGVGDRIVHSLGTTEAVVAIIETPNIGPEVANALLDCWISYK